MFNFYPKISDHHGDALVNCYQSHSEAVATRYYRYKRNGNFTEPLKEDASEAPEVVELSEAVTTDDKKE